MASSLFKLGAVDLTEAYHRPAVQLGSGIGLVLGAVGGALLWPAHRIIGAFLVGGFLGAPVGASVGYAVSERGKDKAPTALLPANAASSAVPATVK